MCGVICVVLVVYAVLRPTTKSPDALEAERQPLLNKIDVDDGAVVNEAASDDDS